MADRLDEQAMALVAAGFFENGWIVNLGAGIPVRCSNAQLLDREVLWHSENGVVGYGEIITNADEADLTLLNASGHAVARRPGMALCDHAESFTMIHGGHIDLSVLGALEVSEQGDLANWLLAGTKVGSLGGAMDLAFCAKRIFALMTHTTKDGKPKIVKQCESALTAPRCVTKIITDIAVVDVTPDGLVLTQVAPGWTPDAVQELTEPKLKVSSDLREMAIV